MGFKGKMGQESLLKGRDRHARRDIAWKEERQREGGKGRK